MTLRTLAAASLFALLLPPVAGLAGPKKTAELPGAWLAPSLPGLRGGDGTYDEYRPESLPPIDEKLLDGTLRWLTPLPPKLEESAARYRPRPEDRDAMDRRYKALLRQAQQAKVRLPAAFTALMASRALQDRFPSPTACYFDLPSELTQLPAFRNTRFIRFLNDQQGVLYWYLMLRPDGTDAVVVSGDALDDPDTRAALGNKAPRLSLAAPSFEAFLYRYWLESTLWHALNDKAPLTPAQERYAAFYKAR